MFPFSIPGHHLMKSNSFRKARLDWLLGSSEPTKRKLYLTFRKRSSGSGRQQWTKQKLLKVAAPTTRLQVSLLAFFCHYRVVTFQQPKNPQSLLKKLGRKMMSVQLRVTE